MKGKTRYNVRLVARKGVGVEETGFKEAWDTFYGLLEGTAERNGFAIHRSHEYLHDSMRAMYDAGQGRFFFAAYEGELLAAIFVFTFGEKCWYIHGASSNERRNLMPTYLLQWEVMRWARERGIRYCDMVAVPSPENLDEEDPL